VSKVLPDLHIRNILPLTGKRKEIWHSNGIVIESPDPDSKYRIVLEYFERENKSFAQAFLFKKQSVAAGQEPQTTSTRSRSNLDVSAVILDESNPGISWKRVMKIKGFAGGEYTCTKLPKKATRSTDKSNNRSKVFWDHREFPKQEIVCNSEDELESLRIWKVVSDSILGNDMQAANKEKLVIENSQRQRRMNGISLKPKLFVRDELSAFWSPTEAEIRH
jgi:hypothetical protein